MSNILNGITEAKRSPEPNYDDPSWDNMVSNVGQKAKEGPRKTVWVPDQYGKGGRYTTVPVNAPKKDEPTKESVGIPYPGTYEETNDMFKSSGQKRIGTLTTEQGVAEGEYDSRKPFGVRYKVFAGREGRLTTKEYWTTSEEKLQKAVDKIEALGNFYEIDGYSYPKEPQGVAEGWSQKYKKSINCSHPKGFSQKAHCAGKKKHNESIDNIRNFKC